MAQEGGNGVVEKLGISVSRTQGVDRIQVVRV